MVRQDLAAAGATQYSSMVTLVVFVAYEWGPGNETVLAWMSSVLIQADGGWPSLVLPGAVAALFSFLQQ